MNSERLIGVLILTLALGIGAVAYVYGDPNRLTNADRVKQAQANAQVDYSKLNDAEIDAIGNINDVKKFLKELTKAVMADKSDTKKAKKSAGPIQ